MTDFNGNLDAYHDRLLAKHNDDYDPPWTVVCADDGEDGFLVVDEDGESDGEVYETWKEAEAEAHRKNTETYDADDYY